MIAEVGFVVCATGAAMVPQESRHVFGDRGIRAYGKPNS